MLARIGVSLDETLLAHFDRLIREKGYTNRSEAIRDLIREQFVEQEWASGAGTMMGVALIVYDHHALDLPQRLADEQHEHYGEIVSTLHVHVDRHNCLEVVILRGKARDIQSLADRLISTRGVKHGRFIATTTGKGM